MWIILLSKTLSIYVHKLMTDVAFDCTLAGMAILVSAILSSNTMD